MYCLYYYIDENENYVEFDIRMGTVLVNFFIIMNR